MEILIKPKSFLSTVTVIDLDTQLPTMTAQQAWDFADRMYGKKIYFIDKNDTTATTVKLIQVKYLMDTRPKNDPFENANF
ncbi:MAG: hypothetical protein PHD21_01900 [Flavobacteriales bacterium]|nr:hypothetical protein [Flavobacteriales bacterium]